LCVLALLEAIAVDTSFSVFMNKAVVSFGASISCNFLSAVDSIILSKASKAHAVPLNEFFSFFD